MIARPLPPPQSIWKKKKNFLYRRNQQPPSCRGSELGFLLSTIFNFETELSNQGLTAFSRPKRSTHIISELFWAKKRGFDRCSSARKPRISDFPLSAALHTAPIAVPSTIVYREQSETRQRLADTFAQIYHFLAVLHFYGAYGDFCMKEFDVTKNGLFEHPKITTC